MTNATLPTDLVEPAEDERSSVREVRELFARSDGRRHPPKLQGPDDQQVSLPDSLFRVLKQAAEILAHHCAVAVLPVEA